jgi:UDP-N-acetylglucosamine:LPS N-acetylglucosamine transferase
MDELLAGADVLWTKPSELVFYAALGLPLVLSWPVGVHERYNRRWVEEHGAGLRQRDPGAVAEHVAEWLVDGTLAAAAWSGFTRLPNRGLYEILDALRGPTG